MDGNFLTLEDGLQRKVVAILAAQALREPSGLTLEMTLESLGIDSLGMAEIIFAIEEDFDVQVPFNANDPDAAGLDLGTVGSVCAAVSRLVREQRG
ncbi:acyl carrier protein [Pararhodobacter sp. CCB-MM2]|uniref:acyl carrier protein n=1 Tax=Pararhodobacter sp. CCB-MM2 TaxID=1786003 RepID=UPI0008325BC4|nr:acyl carrier protein [Pararhodobacter sp. CCB-MM2]MCA2012441.1 acyl carrier protein [Cereibacter sphaeroides]